MYLYPCVLTGGLDLGVLQFNLWRHNTSNLHKPVVSCLCAQQQSVVRCSIVNKKWREGLFFTVKCCEGLYLPSLDHREQPVCHLWASWAHIRPFCFHPLLYLQIAMFFCRPWRQKSLFFFWTRFKILSRRVITLKKKFIQLFGPT